MGGDRDPQSIASAFLLSCLFHNTLVAGAARAHLWAGLSGLPRGVPTPGPGHREGCEGWERGRSSQAQKLDLTGTFHSHPVLGICSPAISCKSASHSVDISTLQRERPAGNPCRAGDFPRRSGRQEAAPGPACLRVFRNPNSSCAIYQVVELFCACGVLVVNKMKCISEKKIYL